MALATLRFDAIPLGPGHAPRWTVWLRQGPQLGFVQWDRKKQFIFLSNGSSLDAAALREIAAFTAQKTREHP